MCICNHILWEFWYFDRDWFAFVYIFVMACLCSIIVGGGFPYVSQLGCINMSWFLKCWHCQFRWWRLTVPSGTGSVFKFIFIMVIYDNCWQHAVMDLISSKYCGDIVMWPDLFVFCGDLVRVLSLIFDALFIHWSVRYDVLIFDDWVMDSMCVDENRWGLAKVHSLSRLYAVGSSVPFEIVFCWGIFLWHRFPRINKLSSGLRVKLWSWIWYDSSGCMSVWFVLFDFRFLSVLRVW